MGSSNSSKWDKGKDTDMKKDMNSDAMCKPGDNDYCRRKYSDNFCCAHMMMTDKDGKSQESFACTDAKVVDANMEMNIDGMKVRMMCSDGAVQLAAAAIVSAA